MRPPYPLMVRPSYYGRWGCSCVLIEAVGQAIAVRAAALWALGALGSVALLALVPECLLYAACPSLDPYVRLLH